MSKQDFVEKMYDLRCGEIASEVNRIHKLRTELSELNERSDSNHKHLYERVYKMDGVRAYRAKDNEGEFTKNWLLSIRVDNPLKVFENTPFSYRASFECYTDEIDEYIMESFRQLQIADLDLEMMYHLLMPRLEGDRLIIDIVHPTQSDSFIYSDSEMHLYALLFAAHFILHRRKTFANDFIKHFGDDYAELWEKYDNRKELGDDAWQAQMYRMGVDGDWFY